MTKIIVAQDAPVLLAIDIAKARHEVLIAIPDKKRRRRLTVLNELADFNRLVTALKEYGRPVRVSSVNRSSSGKPHGTLRCVERCWPSVRQTLRSDTLRACRT